MSPVAKTALGCTEASWSHTVFSAVTQSLSMLFGSPGSQPWPWRVVATSATSPWVIPDVET